MSESGVPEPLADSVREHTLDGVVLRLEPVFAPVPPLLVGLLCGGLATTVCIAVASVVARAGLSPVVAQATGVALVATTMAGGLAATVATHALTIRAVVIELGATRLRVHSEGWLRRPLDLPLASVRAIEASDSALEITTDAAHHRVRIPGRSHRTRDALAALVSSVRARLEPRIGDARDVPEELRDLRGGERE